MSGQIYLVGALPLRAFSPTDEHVLQFLAFQSLRTVGLENEGDFARITQRKQPKAGPSHVEWLQRSEPKPGEPFCFENKDQDLL